MTMPTWASRRLDGWRLSGETPRLRWLIVWQNFAIHTSQEHLKGYSTTIQSNVFRIYIFLTQQNCISKVKSGMPDCLIANKILQIYCKNCRTISSLCQGFFRLFINPLINALTGLWRCFYWRRFTLKRFQCVQLPCEYTTISNSYEKYKNDFTFVSRTYFDSVQAGPRECQNSASFDVKESCNNPTPSDVMRGWVTILASCGLDNKMHN